MKKPVTILALLALVLAAMVGSVWAQEETEEGSPVSAEITADYFSKYVWRGDVITDGSVIQPGVSATLSAGPVDLTAGVWGNIELDYQEDFTEVDYYFDATFGITDELYVSAGYIGYHFPQASNDGTWTQETYGVVGADIPVTDEVAVGIGVGGYWDTDDGDGTYWNAFAGTSFQVYDSGDFTVSLDPGASIGYNDQQWGHGAGWADLLLSLGATVAVNDYVSFGPSFHWSHGLDEEYSDATFWGLSAALAF